MQHTWNALITIAAIVLLCGCATTCREALQQKLEGKNAAERRVILAGVRPGNPERTETGRRIQCTAFREDEEDMRGNDRPESSCEYIWGCQEKVRPELVTRG